MNQKIKTDLDLSTKIKMMQNAEKEKNKDSSCNYFENQSFEEKVDLKIIQHRKQQKKPTLPILGSSMLDDNKKQSNLDES